MVYLFKGVDRDVNKYKAKYAMASNAHCSFSSKVSILNTPLDINMPYINFMGNPLLSKMSKE